MDERIPPGSYFKYSPSGIHSSHHALRSPSASFDKERYLAELLAERQKLAPFVQVVPFCNRLLNQEILRASSYAPNQNSVDLERFELSSPFRLVGQPSNGEPMELEGWSYMQTEENGYLKRRGTLQASSVGWNGVPGVTNSHVLKKVVKLDVPVEKYPNYNFVGRLLGPRGNSLKRVEANTQCRVYIRGRGSVKDSIKVTAQRQWYWIARHEKESFFSISPIFLPYKATYAGGPSSSKATRMLNFSNPLALASFVLFNHQISL